MVWELDVAEFCVNFWVRQADQRYAFGGGTFSCCSLCGFGCRHVSRVCLVICFEAGTLGERYVQIAWCGWSEPLPAIYTCLSSQRFWKACFLGYEAVIMGFRACTKPGCTCKAHCLLSDSFLVCHLFYHKGLRWSFMLFALGRVHSVVVCLHCPDGDFMLDSFHLMSCPSIFNFFTYSLKQCSFWQSSL